MKGKRPKIRVWLLQETERGKTVIPAYACQERATSWHWGRAVFFVPWSNTKGSAIPQECIKQTSPPPLDSVTFPFAFPTPSLWHRSVHPTAQRGHSIGGNLPCTSNQTSKHAQLARFYPCAPKPFTHEHRACQWGWGFICKCSCRKFELLKILWSSDWNLGHMLVKPRKLRGENLIWSINIIFLPWSYVKVILHHIPNKNSITRDHRHIEFQEKYLQQ